MRAEQYYPTVCYVSALGVSLLSGLLTIYSIWLMCYLTVFFHTPTLSCICVNPLIFSIYSVVVTVCTLRFPLLPRPLFNTSEYLSQTHTCDLIQINFSVIVGVGMMIHALSRCAHTPHAVHENVCLPSKGL